MQSDNGLIDEFIDTTFVGLLLIHKQPTEDVKATKLVEFLVGSHPCIGLFGGIRQILEEVEGCLFGNFLCGHLFHPDVNHLWQHDISRHHHRGEDLALTHILFPQCDGEVVVFADFIGFLAKARQGSSPVQLVIDALISHGLSNRPVHHLAERLLDLFHLCLYVHIYLIYIRLAYSVL